MLFILDILLCVALGIIVFQDFKYRAIHVLLITAIFLGGILESYFESDSVFTFIKAALFVGIVITFIWVYLSVKEKRFVNPLKKSIGLGDILFFVAITPLFSLHNYMLFFIAAMVVSILFAVIFRTYVSKKLIPLAGIMAACLLALKLTDQVIPQNLFFELDLLLLTNFLI